MIYDPWPEEDDSDDDMLTEAALPDVDAEDLGSGFHVVTLGPDGDDGWAE